MEINYELEKNDLDKFYRQHATNQSTHKSLVYFFVTVFYTFVFADLIYLIVSGWGNFNNLGEIMLSVLLRFGIGLVLMIALYLTAFFLQKKQLNKIDSIQNNGILCEHKIVFNENELIEVTDVNTSKHSWLSIGDIQELEDFVFIDVNFVGTHFIPKRYFNDESHIKEFVETAEYYQNSAKDKFNASHLASFDRESNRLSE